MRPSYPSPPSLAEIDAIVRRRRRQRVRVAGGVAGVVLVGSVALGLQQRGGPDDDLAAAVPSTRPPAASQPACRSASSGEEAPFVVDGVDRYLARSDVPSFEEMGTIAADWGIPLAEAKAVVGFAADAGLEGFGPQTDDELIAQLPGGLSFEQMTAIAADWNVAVPTVKMLDVLGVSAVTDGGAGC